MPITKTTLRNNVLKRIGVLADGETARPEQAADVEAVYDQLHAMLFEEGAVRWLLADSIPDWAAIPMREIVAADCAPLFEVPFQVPSGMGMDHPSVRTLRKHYQRDIRLPVEAEYF